MDLAAGVNLSVAPWGGQLILKVQILINTVYNWYTHKTSGFKTSGFKATEMSGLQNVRFTKRQVFKTSGCKKTSIYILYLWLVEIRRFC